MNNDLKKEKIGFVILTWNSEKYIKRCLDSIVKIESIYSEIYVIDNGSTDNTIRIVQKFVDNTYDNSKVNVVKLKYNYGTTKSRNIGIKELERKCDYICILDSDTEINEEAVLNMICILKKDNRNGIVGPKMCDEAGVVQNSGRKIPTITIKLLKILPFKSLKSKAEKMEEYPERMDDYRFTGYLMSACWMIKTSVVKNIGLLDEKIFYAPEDVEYCLRAWTRGYRVLYCQNVQIIHSWQRLSRKKLFSKHNYEHIKGLIYMYHKYKFLFSNKKFEKYFN